MACVIKVTDKRSGITYAYRSVSYWDKEKKAPRNRRTLIGRVDPVTGEIVPTDGRRRKSTTAKDNEVQNNVMPVTNTTTDHSIYINRLESILGMLQNLTSEVKSIQDELRSGVVSN